MQYKKKSIELKLIAWKQNKNDVCFIGFIDLYLMVRWLFYAAVSTKYRKVGVWKQEEEEKEVNDSRCKKAGMCLSGSRSRSAMLQLWHVNGVVWFQVGHRFFCDAMTQVNWMRVWRRVKGREGGNW